MKLLHFSLGIYTVVLFMTAIGWYFNCKPTPSIKDTESSIILMANKRAFVVKVYKADKWNFYQKKFSDVTDIFIVAAGNHDVKEMKRLHKIQKQLADSTFKYLSN